MWPSVPTFRHFSNVTCPAGTKCELPYCIFSHGTVKAAIRSSASASSNVLGNEPSAKRQKLNDARDESSDIAPDTPTASRAVFTGLSASKDKLAVATKSIITATTLASADPTDGKKDVNTLPQSATRPVSPPPKASAASDTLTTSGPVALMPRKLVKEPAIFTRRLTLLKMLHSFMKPLNDKIAKAVKAEIKALHMDPNQLNKIAVDEEEQIAKANPAVYENVLKQRLFKLKKMTPEEWVKERFEARAKERGLPPKKPPPKKVDTGLTPTEEITFLSTLICSQDGLDAYGYVTKLPTTEQLDEARSAQVSADFWEVCDRCNTRFQVFRSEERRVGKE